MFAVVFCVCLFAMRLQIRDLVCTSLAYVSNQAHAGIFATFFFLSNKLSDLLFLVSVFGVRPTLQHGLRSHWRTLLQGVEGLLIILK